MAALQHPRTSLYPPHQRDDESAAEATERYIFSGDDMGESDLQWAIAVLLTELLADYMQALNLRNKVGGNLEFLYQPGDLKAKVTPDIYLLEDESPEPLDIPSWKVWERGGKVPALAVEVVSRSAAKDYTLDPDGMLARYQQLGVAEVVRYDPKGYGGKRERRLLSHFVRDPAGQLLPQALVRPDAVQLKYLGLWLVHTAGPRLRVGVGSEAKLALWPTRREQIAQADRRAAEATERADREAGRAETEASRAQAEASRAQAEASRAELAEQELAALRAELARVKAGQGT